jgi:tripartite-type tricarboxylate transporter receptor subunit TctC
MKYRRNPAPARRMIALGAVLLAGATVLGACGSSKSPPATTSSGSGSSASFFKGKTITLIAPDAPGGSYDLYARLFAPYLASALGATVNVENIKGAGTLDGTDQMAAATPNGLTIGLVNVGGDTADLVEHHPGVNFNLSKLSWIGQPADVPNVMITQTSSGISSFSSLVHASSPVPVLDVRSGVGDMLNRVVLGAFRIPNHLVTGFSDTSELKQAFLAKDGKLAFEAVTTLYPLIAAGQARPLLITAAPSLSSYRKAFSGTPTLQSELSKVTLSGSQTAAVKEALRLSDLSDDFGGPPGIPAGRLAALRSAFSKAAGEAALKAQATKESLVLDPTDGATLAGQVDLALKQSQSIAPYVSKKS